MKITEVCNQSYSKYFTILILGWWWHLKFFFSIFAGIKVAPDTHYTFGEKFLISIFSRFLIFKLRLDYPTIFCM